MVTSSNSSSIQVRPLKTIDELKAVEELQIEVWGCSEREVLPSLALIPLLDIGGVLLGAFDNQELIGFVLGFPGREAGTSIIHSDMLAVKAAYRSSGLGYKLKLAQREAALANDVEFITWTFDPLQSANAHLNFAKLGVMADRYKVDYYGETSSQLHRTGTDRLWVTWKLKSERVKHRITDGPPKPSLECSALPALLRVDQKGEPQIEELDMQQAAVRIEIPVDINAVLASDEALALRWRAATRAAFSSALVDDFVVEEFFRSTEGLPGSYLLTKS